jgi:signal peptidase I
MTMSSRTNASEILLQEAVRSFGRARFRVLGTSMAPSIVPGDLVSVERARLSDIACGEIVLFSRYDRFFVHRVVRSGETKAQSLVTRGDRLDHDDPPISDCEFLGRVTSIQRGRRAFRPENSINRWNRLILRVLRASDFMTRAYLYVRRSVTAAEASWAR